VDPHNELCGGKWSGTAGEAVPIPVQSLLGDWEGYRFDFHWYEGPSAKLLQWYHENQQDALRLSWTGIVAGTDGGVDWKNERMGAGYVTGTEQEVVTSFSACVGGPLSTLRAEAASLLQLLLDLRGRSPTPLLVFIDCLVLLDILQRWGQASFHPQPTDVVHFDIIFPLLDELRRWLGPLRLVKVKSHTGCLLNERADVYAERGYREETPEICPGPRKFGSVWLGVRPHVRASTAQSGKSLPRDSAPNHSLLKKTVRANARRAVGMRSTTFVRQLLHQQEGATIARCVKQCRPAEYRVWVKMMADRYPVQSYLHRCGLAQSSQCPYCQAQCETLAHFTTICPRFREARTAGHNQVRAKLTSLLLRCLPKQQWKLFEETPMRRTGLELQQVSVACMVAAERLPQGYQGDSVSAENLQPDMVLVSQSLKKIGLLDLCRPFDSLSEQLAAALRRKLCTYAPLLEALRSYVAQGWQVTILPWVVGVRGMINEKSVTNVLNFLQVPRNRQAKIVEDVAIESVKALYSLHQIRYQAFRLNMHKAGATTGKTTTGRMAAASRHGAFDTDDPSTSCSRKRRGRADDDYGETRRRWKKMASEAGRRS
jgi:ribonuclease HI